MKKLEDYLHLYLPVKVELNNGGSKVYNRTAVAVGNMDNEYRYVTLRMGEGTRAFTHSILFSEPDRIKPILRPLSDIKEDEIKKYFFIKGLDCENTTRANIEGNFIQIEYVSGGERKSDYDILHQLTPEQTIYLIRQGFDLFGLIDEGLAVNACELKTGSIA